jgi:hypothetical protein
MSQVSWKKPLALAATLFVLGSAAYWLEYSHKPKKEEATEASKKPFALKDAAVASIRVVDGARVFAFRCADAGDASMCGPGDNSKWELTEPVKARADDSNVNSLLSAMNNLTATEVIDLSVETAEKRGALMREYRLDTPVRSAPGARRLELTLGGKDGGSRVLVLGETHPIGDNIFAVAGATAGGADENRVYMVPSFFKSNFDHDLDYWRDKKLFTVAAHQVTSFRLEGPKGRMEGSRRDGEWHLKPLDTKEELAGDIENIDNLLSAATFLNAKKFVAERKDDPAAKSALKGASKLLTLALGVEAPAPAASPAPGASPAPAAKAAAPTVITLLQKKGGGPLYATVSTNDPLYELEPSAKERIDKSVKDLRLSKLVTSMERFTAKRLEFAGKPMGAEPLQLANEDSKWVLLPKKDEAEAKKVQDLLDKISGNRIKDFLTGAKIPTGEQGGLRLTLGDEKNEKKRQLVFWKSGELLYARDLGSSRKEAFQVDTAIKDALPWQRDFFNKSAPAPQPSAAPHAPMTQAKK